MADKNTPHPTVPRKRRRPALSCEQCRARKIKCDRGNPCKQCLQSKSQACSYTPPPPTKALPCHQKIFTYTDPILSLTATAGNNPSRSPPNQRPENPYPENSFPPISVKEGLTEMVGASPTYSLTGHSKIIGSTATDSVSSQSPHPVFDTAPSSTTWATLRTPSVADRDSDVQPTVQALLERVQNLEQRLSESNSSVERLRNQKPRHSKELRGTLSKTRYFGQSHWLYSFGRFESIVCVKENTVLHTPTFNDEWGASEVLGLLEKCKSMAKTSKMEVHREWLANPEPLNLVPSREICDILIGHYFRTSESLYRILHFPSFHKEYNQFWEQPSAASTSFVLKMLLAMANGVCFYEGLDSSHIRTQAKKWIFAGNHWLSTAPTEKGRLNISGLQIHCLLILARQALGIVGDLVWISIGTLVRTALSMGFNRDPKYFPRMTALHAELRRRLWATILELNVQLSLDSGMNPLISVDDYDTEPPANIDDADIDEMTENRPIWRPMNVFTQTTVQLVLLKSLPLRLRICRFTNDFRFEPTYDEVLQFGSEITQACKDSIAMIQATQGQDSPFKITQLHRNLLDMSTRRFILAIHRGFSLKAQTDPRYYYSRKTCLDSAIIMSTYPSSPTKPSSDNVSNDPPADDFTLLKLNSCSFFKSFGVNSAMIIFHEILMQIDEDTSLPSPEGMKARAPLKKILQDTVDLIAQKIGLSENNVKGHLFLSAVIGQVDSLEEGKKPEQGALDAARKSAKLCFELLGVRAPSFGKEAPAGELGSVDGGLGGGLQGGDGDGEMVEEFGMQDWNMDLDIPDIWLTTRWEEDRCW